MLPKVTFPSFPLSVLGRAIARTRNVLAVGGLLTVGAIGLSACSTVKDTFDQRALERNPAPCPIVIVLPEASRVIKFQGGEALENVAWTGEINNVETSCRYYEDEPIEAEVKIHFAFGRGPMAQSNQANMKYFVAVTRTNRDLIAKEEFTLPVKFRGDQRVTEMSDTVQKIIIPRKDAKVAGGNFEIVVGFVLTKDEVLFNRSGKSLRFPNLK